MKSERQRNSERSAEIFRAGANSNTTLSEDFWQLYIGFGFIGSVCWFVIVVGIIVNQGFHPPNLVGDAKDASLAVLGISSFLVLVFVPGARGEGRSKLLTFGALPLCLLLVAAQGVFLCGLSVYPAQTERLLGETMMGKYPCRDYGCHDLVDTQAKWWLAFVDRHAGTFEADHAALSLVTSLWALGGEDQKTAVVEALLMAYRKAPDRHRQLMVELGKKAMMEDETGRLVRKLLPAESLVAR